MLRMTNLTPPELPALYVTVHEYISKKWNVVRGQLSPFKPLDVLFMTLVVLKYGGSWAFFGTLV